MVSRIPGAFPRDWAASLETGRPVSSCRAPVLRVPARLATEAGHARPSEAGAESATPKAPRTTKINLKVKLKVNLLRSCRGL